MNESMLKDSLLELIKNYGDIGVFIAMFLESSIVPIPSEAVIIGAGALGISVFSNVIYGSLGSTCGAAVGYALGRYGAKPVILKFGKYIFIQPHHLAQAEAFAVRYGVWGVLLGRLIPIIPFKVFSIAAGITRVPFTLFMFFTLIGVIPRIYLLTIFGALLVAYTIPVVLISLIGIVVFLLGKRIVKKRSGTA